MSMLERMIMCTRVRLIMIVRALMRMGVIVAVPMSVFVRMRLLGVGRLGSGPVRREHIDFGGGDSAAVHFACVETSADIEGRGRR